MCHGRTGASVGRGAPTSLASFIFSAWRIKSIKASHLGWHHIAQCQNAERYQGGRRRREGTFFAAKLWYRKRSVNTGNFTARAEGDSEPEEQELR